MRKSREILLRFYHDPAFSFERVEVCYTDRGASGDESCIGGNHIRALDSRYMEIENPNGLTPIPYHRIKKILYEGIVFWERGRKAVPEKEDAILDPAEFFEELVGVVLRPFIRPPGFHRKRYGVFQGN